MPMMIPDALLHAYESCDEDIITYVSSCAGTSWTYDSYPSFAKDIDVWKNCIEEEKGIFRINLRKAVNRRLNERNISNGNIKYNMDDTITNPHYYSNNAASPYGLNDQSKYGRNFAGAFYKVKK